MTETVIRNRGLRFAFVWLPAALFWGALVWGLATVPEARQPIVWVLVVVLAGPLLAGLWIILVPVKRIVLDDQGITSHFFGSRHYAWNEILDARLVAGPRGGVTMDLCLTLRRDGVTQEARIRVMGTAADPDALLAKVKTRMKGITAL